MKTDSRLGGKAEISAPSNSDGDTAAAHER